MAQRSALRQVVPRSNERARSMRPRFAWPPAPPTRASPKRSACTLRGLQPTAQHARTPSSPEHF
eukprot:1226667-Prymnesium_polylepis.1